MSIGTIDIELRARESKEKKKKNMDKIGRIIILCLAQGSRIFSEIFHTQFCFDMFYAVKSSEVEMT